MQTSKQILSAMLVALTIAGCATGTPILVVARCQFDQPLLEAMPANLPDAIAGDLGALRLNREDSKQAYKELHDKYSALAKEARDCLAAAGSKEPDRKTTLEQRLERIEGRVK